MKLTIAKENGEFEVKLDGEIVERGPTEITREISLFPGQTAKLRCFWRSNSTLRVELRAARNGLGKEFFGELWLQPQYQLSSHSIPERLQIREWIGELTMWAKQIPLREEVEIEF